LPSTKPDQGSPALSTLLSWLLVAYTMELDNEFEHRMIGVGAGRAFRVSLVMWENFLRFVGPDGLRAGDVPDRAGIAPRIHPYLAMERWGYVVVEPGGARNAKSDSIIRLTPIGTRAAEAWQPLHRLVDGRWRARFGDDAVEAVRERLQSVVDELAVGRPRYLPVVGYGMTTAAPPAEARATSDDGATGLLPLSALLSLVLLEFTLEFERGMAVSLPISADVLRVVGGDGTRLRDLPGRAGVSKEAVSVAVGFLERTDHARVGPDPSASRGKVVALTARGRAARDGYYSRVAKIEDEWTARFGADAVDGLRHALAQIVAQRDGERLRLAEGLVPRPGGWRAQRRYASQTEAFVASPTTCLPHHPMVTHRGGWPDGS